jgi:amino-acid N-acetyltransferase
MIRRMVLDEMPAVLSLVRECELPVDGLEGGSAEIFVLDEDGVVSGCVALEAYPPHALVRSLAVAPAARGRGLAATLFDFIANEAKKRGFTNIYALTNTIPGFLMRRGFREICRTEVPASVGESAELRGVCCACARVFCLPI